MRNELAESDPQPWMGKGMKGYGGNLFSSDAGSVLSRNGSTSTVPSPPAPSTPPKVKVTRRIDFDSPPREQSSLSSMNSFVDGAASSQRSLSDPSSENILGFASSLSTSSRNFPEDLVAAQAPSAAEA